MKDKTGREIKFAPKYEITDFHYEFVSKITGIKPEDIVFLSNESSFYDFYSEDNIKDVEEYWLSWIEDVYNIDLRDINHDGLKISILGNELMNRMKQRKF